MIAKITSLTLLAVAAAAFVPVVSAQPVSLNIRVGPPPPRYEAIPAPRRGYAWTPGYWDWRGDRHAWVGGNWMRERPGYVYVRPTWVNDGARYHFYRGAWARGGGDRDGDGVANRYDRDRDNDGVRNRRDRDRDGDGVRNRYDRRPNNPNWR